MIWYLPLEPLHERYTEQMFRWVMEAADRLGIPMQTVIPEGAVRSIEHGQWLDTFGTIGWKAWQVAQVASLFKEQRIRSGDVFLLGDVWFPGVEAIRFMAELAGIKVGLAGWHYAGCYDPEDLLARTLGPWGKEWERMLLKDLLDLVFLGSDYHYDLLLPLDLDPERVWTTGLVWKPDEVRARLRLEWPREKIVVFPHRWAPEKDPAFFAEVAGICKAAEPDWRFVVSTNSTQPIEAGAGLEVVVHPSKAAYYDFLARCTIMFSAARQETFGYALHESIALGLDVLVPDRCSYPEMLHDDERFLYEPGNVRAAAGRLRAKMRDPTPVPYAYTYRWGAGVYQALAMCAALEGRLK